MQAAVLRFFRRHLRASKAQLKPKTRPPSSARNFSDRNHPVVTSDRALEEERLPFYEHEQYYPAHIGDVFNSRYQIVGKLGYGAYSTVWLCRDLVEHSYSALKISTQLQKYPKKGRAELSIYEHLCEVNSHHPGQRYIRELYDSFEIAGPNGSHQCLIQQPMHLSILDMMNLNPKPLDAPFLKEILKRLLLILDFLHTEANVIHTDLKTDNLMIHIADKSMLEEFDKAERENPTPRKVIDELRAIYTSRRFGKPKNGKWGGPILCDFGEARIGQVQETGPFIQPHIYRAPEVTFEMPWGPPVDIWNTAALIWDLFEGRHLFNNLLDEQRKYDPFKHMAQIFALLGPPPKEFLLRSETAEQCFDMEGNWKGGMFEKVPEISLEGLETRLEGREKSMFLNFIRSMLKWLPEERKTAKELLQDPWLNE
ncbi:putative non-specific serine/threonine protein kinase [Microsporum canis]|uniref:non-specific serine/threonine protein kinase n=1 Tax=Arthroderma otae (strain ATCC MYA-4605 / CBS 113480) TaxID=554155 RepID=C5FE08_ARTOC|nr:protein kinase domain-containing protein [Microsporum canis CBS 113480]EEQ28042.1 protein kinase domain-containing protein [Microsporum canis CBS 113480]